MLRIYKYQFSLSAGTIPMPKGSRPLSVQLQHSDMTLWAVVDDVADPNGTLAIRVVGTGHPIGDELGFWNFLGTVQQGQYVWHVFTGARAK